MQAGIYIHIPFCAKKCVYCDFYSLSNRESDIDRFTNSMISEIENTDSDPVKDWQFSTVFFGGGTPSLLEAPQLEKIINALHRVFDLSRVNEITLEANPGEAPYTRLKAYRELGINRLSIGFQSFQPDLLHFLSRIHNEKDCFNTFSNAIKAGFDNINVDMIFNIPGQSCAIWEADLKKILRLNPNHISAYSLTVESGTPLHRQVVKKLIHMPDEDTDILMFTTTRDLLNNAGYPAYEISNFAQPGYECRHNLGYWQLRPYLGFGPSAHSYDVRRRRWNTASLDAYLNTIKNGGTPIAGFEMINETDRFNELIFNGLRMTTGIHIPSLKQLYPGDFHQFLKRTLSYWKELKITNDHLTLFENGVLLADEIAADLFLIPD